MHQSDNKKANRLAKEKSPYLLQHAYNPVDWYPWGEEAFARARREDKPIFLSIGYSTCHWCHVMERESFEDEEVAKTLNRVFVCIKVDREERPDIDNLYMAACQALTGSGGWPLTVLLLPDRRPFFAGTYFPRESRYGRMGVIELAQRVEKIWQSAREEITRTADSIMTSLRAAAGASPGEMPGEEVLHRAYEQLAQRFDPRFGGFGLAPKFPTPHNLTFLLRYWKRTGEEKARLMVESTLLAMRRGGIFDHLGFGFHRYSTDRKWLLPHFEKMLYDQALLAIAYLEAFQATGNSQFAITAREIFAYVLRDMTSPEGGFYSAEDADSEGEEGRFYVWSAGEIRSALGQEDADLFMAAYNILESGNFLDEVTRTPSGYNIPHLTRSTAELAELMFMEEETLIDRLTELRKKLFAARATRTRPNKDDKILTDWNGLMIAALAVGGRVLDDQNYTLAAQKAAVFLLSHLKKDGQLLKRYRDGEAALAAQLDDYAFMVWGLLELYETTFNIVYLREALALNKVQLDHFWDKEIGGFYLAPNNVKDLPVRPREIYDGAIPSGNSVAALNNLRLARLTGNAFLEEVAAKIVSAFAKDIKDMPSAYTQLLSALDFLLGPSLEVVIAGEAGAADTQAMLRKLRSTFVPNKVVLLHATGEDGRQIEELAPYTREQKSIAGKATAYICRNFTCQPPVTDADSMLAMLY